MPLDKLQLNISSRRAEHINQLNRPRDKIVEKNRIIASISKVLRGIRAPAAASTNWPSIVLLSECERLKLYGPNEGGICRYHTVRYEARVVDGELVTVEILLLYPPTNGS
jgi:hypothetical protein